MNTEAAEWLEAIFDSIEENGFPDRPEDWPGFYPLRSMFEILPQIDDEWTAMTVTSSDYLNPGRWWL